MATIDYSKCSEDELYYYVGQAAVWYLIKGGKKGMLTDLLSDAAADAREHRREQKAG